MMDNIAPPGLIDLNPVMDRLISEKTKSLHFFVIITKSLNLGNIKKEMGKDFSVFHRGN